MPDRPVSYRGAIRRALRVSTVEGVLAEWVSACAGGGALIAWGLHLGAAPGLVCLLAALPALAQTFQLPAARLTARLGARRTAILLALAARQPYAVLAVLPWLPVGPSARLALFVSIAVVAAAGGAVAHHAWLSWTLDLFRGPIRARVLARRGGRMALAGGCGGLAVGALLDAHGGGARTAVLAVLATVAWLGGIASAAVLARQHAPRVARRPRARPAALSAALAPRRVRRGLGYVVAWNGAVGISATAGVTFMVEHLGLGLVPVALHGLAGAACGAAAAPLWGRLVVRAGVTRVLASSALGAALLPFLWLAVSERVLWPIAVDGILGGLLLGGQGLAASILPRALAGRGRSAEVVASYSTAAGLALGGAALASGFVASRLPFAVALGGVAVSAKKLVFVAGGTARLGAALLSARVARAEREARGAPSPAAAPGRAPRSVPRYPPRGGSPPCPPAQRSP